MFGTERYESGSGSTANDDLLNPRRLECVDICKRVIVSALLTIDPHIFMLAHFQEQQTVLHPGGTMHVLYIIGPTPHRAVLACFALLGNTHYRSGIGVVPPLGTAAQVEAKLPAFLAGKCLQREASKTTCSPTLD